MLRTLPAIALLLAWPAPAFGQALHTYECQVTRKFDSDGRQYSSADLARSQFSVRVIEGSAGSTLQRCSFATSAGRVTCDSYEADRVAVDPTIGVRKYYHFRSHFDVQIFRDGTFIENNGRGSIGIGQCR